MFVKLLRKIKNRLFNVPKKRSNIKQNLTIIQEEDQFIVKGNLTNHTLIVSDLYLKSRFSKHTYTIKNLQPSNKFYFRFGLNDLPKEIYKQKQIFDLYLVTYKPSNDKINEAINNDDIKGFSKDKQTQYIRLGNFVTTDSSNCEIVTIDEKKCLLYKTKNGNISLAISYDIKPRVNVSLKNFKLKNNQIIFGGKIKSINSQIKEINLSIRSRESDTCVKYPITFTMMDYFKGRNVGDYTYEFFVNVNPSQLFTHDMLYDTTYDLYLEIKTHAYGHNICMRLGRPHYRSIFFRSAKVTRDKDLLCLSSYITVRDNLSLRLEKFEPRIYKRIYKIFRKSKFYFPIMQRLYSFISRSFPVNNKLILFESSLGKQYSDSPKYIYEEMIKRKINYKKVWVYDGKKTFNDSSTVQVERFSPRYYYYLARAKFWINNQNFPHYLKKREETIYLQTWHGTPLKKMLFDLDQVIGRKPGYIERVSKSISQWDYLISPSPYATRVFISAFNFKGKIIESGYPRNDIFYCKHQDSHKKRIRTKLKIPKDKKVILYAPTFRDNQIFTNNRFKFNMNLNLRTLKRDLGDNYVMLFRTHLVISNKIHFDHKVNNFIKDVSDYSDVQELLLIADILITDYSSVMFDFANTNKPILFYTYDLAEYRDKVRGFYMNFELEAPGPLLKTTDQIVQSILNIKEVEKKYKERYKRFYKEYCPLEDGKASKRIVDLINKQ